MLKPRPDMALSSGFSTHMAPLQFGGKLPAAPAKLQPDNQPYERAIIENAQRLAAEVQSLAQRRAQVYTMLEEHDRAIMQKQAALEALRGVLAAIAPSHRVL
jgi:hypothetical protein